MHHRRPWSGYQRVRFAVSGSDVAAPRGRSGGLTRGGGPYACRRIGLASRRVSVRGAIMVGGQKIQVGLAHARKTVEEASAT
jgi:hypothetical protein